MGNRVVHFEIEAEDVNRAKKFYEQAFGWKMEQMGSEYSQYVVVTTGDPKEPGGINGGIYSIADAKQKKKQVNAYRCVIAVDDIKKAIEDGKKAGGKITKENETPDDVPNVGLFIACEDSEGNMFSLLQPSPDMTSSK